MSYNIDTFKIKKIENFTFPVASLYKHERTDWHPHRENNDDGTVTFSDLETILYGTVKDDIFYCTEIDCSGEGSGTFMNWILEPAFKESSGILVASCVWEGGDSINQLCVKNGKVSWIDIDI